MTDTLGAYKRGKIYKGTYEMTPTIDNRKLSLYSYQRQGSFEKLF